MDPESLLRVVVTAFAYGDLAPLFLALNEKLVWKTGASVNDGVLVSGGEYLDRAGVIAHVSRLSSCYYFKAYTAKDIVSDGEIAWGLFDVEATFLPPGRPESERKPVRFENAIRLRVRNGKILEYRSYLDTAGLLAQQSA